MQLNQFNTIYFIGAGGIGMSALARYFNTLGKKVLGYDKTETALTKLLLDEGIEIHYNDMGSKVLDLIPMKENTLVIYTPAVPKEFGELTTCQNEDYTVIKRAAALGIISKAFETIGVAGTHGKTTTTSILANVLSQTKKGCNAFIGGIATNFNSNCVLNENSKRVVLEADEFDRSFLQLKPNYSIVTSVDADHLDVYGDGSAIEASFKDYLDLTNKEGFAVVHADTLEVTKKSSAKLISYGSNKGDFQLINYRFKQGKIFFDVKLPTDVWEDVEFGIPGRHNAENALAVLALCYQLGINETIIRDGLASFKGVKRRFEYHVRTEDKIYIDDYAHHPTEIEALLKAVKELYPTKKLSICFQPHLFSRTRDFMDGFASALSIADEVVLLDVYPARELPLEGITSEALLRMITAQSKTLVDKTKLADWVKLNQPELFLTIGAGDIDTCVEPVKNVMEE